MLYPIFGYSIFILKAYYAQMLKQYFNAYKYKYYTSRNFGFIFVFKTEYIAYL